MAVVALNRTSFPSLSPGLLRHLQYDSVAIDLDAHEYARLGSRLVELSSCGPAPAKKIDADAIQDLFMRPGSGTAESYRAVLTNAQYRSLIEYLCLDEYYYQSFGDVRGAEAVLALSFGTMPDVNVAIAEGIITSFWSASESRFRVPVYAQEEVADALRAHLKPSGDRLPDTRSSRQIMTAEQESYSLHRVGGKLVRKSSYINTEDVVGNCSGNLAGGRIALACQAWHAPRCYHECLSVDMNVISGICVDLFSPRDPQPWVQSILAWIIKEAESWRRRRQFL